MDPRLDRAMDKCAVDMARAMRDGTNPNSVSLWAALRLLGAVHETADGGEAVERAKFAWLTEEVLRRLVNRLETGLLGKLPPDCAPAIAATVGETFGNVMEDVDRILDGRGR